MSSDRIIIGAPPGRPGRPTGGVPEVASGSVSRSPVRSEVRSSRGAALDRVFDSISEITEGLLEIPLKNEFERKRLLTHHPSNLIRSKDTVLGKRSFYYVLLIFMETFFFHIPVL